MMPDPIGIDGGSLTCAPLAAVAAGAPVALDEAARARMEESAAWYRAQGIPNVLRAKWSILVGGAAPEDDARLIRDFVLGHCAGVGDPLPPEAVRATMLARANVLATGASGARARCVDVLLAMLNAGVVPVVPAQGSVGAAGDLAPLAHICRVACGWGGQAWRDGVLRPAADAMVGLPRMAPDDKEALSLINGATLTAALAALACVRAERLLETAESACALSFEVNRADLGCLHPRALASRRHPGGVRVATRLAALLDGSALVHFGRRPDPFSVRCAPAVLGAAVDALAYVRGIVEDELNGACDNPLVFPDAGVFEAGNFHGAPTALAMDHLKVALVQVASIAERRVFRMTYGQLSGLPSYLARDNGMNSGLMLAQYTAASLVSECKGKAFPASVDSIPTIQHYEDHVSMGPIAARGALDILEAVADVLAIELICAAQGLEFHGPERAAPATRALHAAVREEVAPWDRDRALYPDLDAIGAAVRAGRFTHAPGPW